MRPHIAIPHAHAPLKLRHAGARSSAVRVLALAAVLAALTATTTIAVAPPTVHAEQSTVATNSSLQRTSVAEVPGASTVAEITLNGVAPAIVRPGDVLVLTGLVRNISKTDLAQTQAILRLSRDRLDSRVQIRKVATDARLRPGIRETTAFVELGDLEPGESAPFTISADVNGLELGPRGVYVIGVDVRATTSGQRGTVDIARTEVPWIPEQAPSSIPVATVLPLNTTPTLLPDGTMLGDDLAEELAPTGRLGGRLASVAEVPIGRAVTWLIDPDLVTTAQDMSDGYRTHPVDGPVEGVGDAGQGEVVAQEFLAGLGAAVAADDSAGRMPTANPDIAALATATDRDWAQELVTGSLVEPVGFAEAAGRSLPVVAGAPAAGFTAEGSDLLAAAGGVTVLVGDTGLRASLRPNDPGVAPELATRQRILAETFIAAEESAPRLVFLAPPTWTGGAGETRTMLEALELAASWVRPDKVAPTDAVDPAEGAAGRPIPQRHIRAVQALDDEVQSYSDILEQPEGVLATYQLNELRATATSWRGQNERASLYLATSRSQLVSATAGVEVLVPETVTLSARTGRFPLTVANNLNAPVVVRLQFAPANRDRLSIADPGEIRLDAGERATLSVEATATSNGQVPVAVVLTTPAGEPFGPVQTMAVVATQYGTVGWIFVAVGFTLLMLTAVRGVTRRIRERRLERASKQSEGQSDHQPDRIAGQPSDPATLEPGDQS